MVQLQLSSNPMARNSDRGRQQDINVKCARTCLLCGSIRKNLCMGQEGRLGVVCGSVVKTLYGILVSKTDCVDSVGQYKSSLCEYGSGWHGVDSVGQSKQIPCGYQNSVGQSSRPCVESVGQYDRPCVGKSLRQTQWEECGSVQDKPCMNSVGQ